MKRINKKYFWTLWVLLLPIISCSQWGKYSSCLKHSGHKLSCSYSSYKKGCHKKYHGQEKSHSSCQKSCSHGNLLGGCDDHKIDLYEELSQRDNSFVQLPIPPSKSFMPMKQKVEITLSDESTFNYLSQPRKKLPIRSKGFAGLTLLKFQKVDFTGFL